MEVVTDGIRSADADNPKGYYEFEQVKTIQRDASWLPATRGKAFKMVSQLLYDLPPGETYRIVFMERDLEETLLSQERMLARLARPAAPREQMKRAYVLHLERLHKWLSLQSNMEVLLVRYNDLVEQPREQTERVGEFIGGNLNVGAMAKTVDLSLYRNRTASGAMGPANSA